jgi:hypothetical protein
MFATMLGAGFFHSGASASETLADAFVRDSEWDLHFRTYYFDRLNPGDVTNAAWAAGGWIGYRSGWVADLLRVGAVGYTSQRLWGPLDKDGSGLLAPEQEPYSVFGEAYASLKLWDQVLTGGRFQVYQPEISPSDIRMTPITYSGGNLSGTLAGIDYFAAYLNATKPRNSESFQNFTEAAGITGADGEPLWLLGLAGQPMKEMQWRLSSYYVPNVLSSTYADTSWLTPLSADYQLRLGAQAMYQTSVGDNLLTGSAFSNWSGGVKADLIAGPATLSVVYQQTGSEVNYQNPYSSWAGYTNMIVKAFNLAGMKAWLIGGSYDFAALGAPGFAVRADIVHGWDAIDPGTGAAQPNWTEYDLTLDYRFSAKTWPEWARSFWLRGRAANVDMGSDGDLQDYRIIINYDWKF